MDTLSTFLELCEWNPPEQVMLPMIWDTMTLMWHHYDDETLEILWYLLKHFL